MKYETIAPSNESLPRTVILITSKKSKVKDVEIIQGYLTWLTTMLENQMTRPVPSKKTEEIYLQ